MGYGGHWGAVSGILGMTCARHMFVLPGGELDLEKGEQYVQFAHATISACWG